MKLYEYLKNDELHKNFPFAVVNVYSDEVKCLFLIEEDGNDFVSYQDSINVYDFCCVSADRILND